MSADNSVPPTCAEMRCPPGRETAFSDAATKARHRASRRLASGRCGLPRGACGRLSTRGGRLLDVDGVLTSVSVLCLVRRVLRGSGWDWRLPNIWVALEIPGRK